MTLTEKQVQQLASDALSVAGGWLLYADTPKFREMNPAVAKRLRNAAKRIVAKMARREP